MTQTENLQLAPDDSEPVLSEDLKLIRWIESHPRYAHLVKQATETTTPPASPHHPQLQWVLKTLKGLLISEASDYHGTAYVTDNVQKDAKVTASIVTTSNIIDALGNFPILLFTMGGVANPLGLFFSLGTTLALLKIGNDMSKTVVRGKEGSKAWAFWVAIIGLVPLALLKTFTTGVGVELINNRPGLSQLLATELAEERLADTQQALEQSGQAKAPSYLTVKERCDQGKAELSQMPKDSPLWASTYVNLHGQWSERSSNWQTLPLEKLPICRQVTRLEEAANRKFELEQVRYQQLRADRQQMGNDLDFLQANYPQVYDQHFHQQGEIKSGVEAAAYALESFSTKLMNGQWAQIWLSLFTLAISFLTSTVACYMVLTYARRQDVQMSWDENLRQERDRWLNDHFNLLLQRHAQESQNVFQARSQDADWN